MADHGMRELFLSGKTVESAYRRDIFRKLYTDVRAKKDEIVGYIGSDLGKTQAECMVIYASMIEKPLRTAARRDWLRWSFLTPVLPDLITTGRLYRKPLGQVLIEADPREPFLFVFPRFLASLMAGNPTVLTFAGKVTSTASFLTDLVNKDVPEEFGTIVFAGEDIPMESPEYVFAEEYPGHAVAVFDATADFDKGAKKLVYAWRRMNGLCGIKPEVIYCPAEVREVLVREINKWAFRMPDDLPVQKIRVIGYEGDDDLAAKLDAEGEMFALNVFSDEDSYAERIALARPFKYASINSVTLRAPSMRAYFNEFVTTKTIMMR